jgi:catechol 2,3-dioxygenase-like lactoylglutathione lyase family enzyme
VQINFANLYVDDQEKALQFYTHVLGFEKKADLDLGAGRWLTVVAPGTQLPELVLTAEQSGSVKFKKRLFADGVPFTAFAVPDVKAEVDRLKALDVVIVREAWDMGPITAAVFDDGCGNLIMLVNE